MAQPVGLPIMSDRVISDDQQNQTARSNVGNRPQTSFVVSRSKSVVQTIWTFIEQHKKFVIAALLFNFILTYAFYNHYLYFSVARKGSTNHYSVSSFLNDWHIWNYDPADLHLESGDTFDHVDSWNNVTYVVAIGMGITSRGVKNLDENRIASDFQLFTTFLPSFCKTASPGYGYAFYMAYDFSDAAFSQPSFLAKYQTAFRTFVDRNCPSEIQSSVHMVQCSHTGKPAWAQNDAMLDAYLDNVDYFYRINDDTVLQTSKWTEIFISVLQNYNPPNLGVVGPTHQGGNLQILTYDFVHRTHVDALGFYYPRLFTDWWGDDWVTNVYIPDRSTKLSTVSLAHTLSLGQRYDIRDWNVKNLMLIQVATDQETIHRFVEISKRNTTEPPADGTKLIAMSLYGKDLRYTWGAIRNAQLMRFYFPGWRLRFYVPDPKTHATKSNSAFVVPSRIVRKLKQLGAEVEYVPASDGVIPPKCWRYLVADDAKVNYFLIRDADSRLSERDAFVVDEWIRESQSTSTNSTSEISLHCIRDHPDHINRTIVDGLWGGNGPLIRRVLPHRTMSKELRRFFTHPPDTVSGSNGAEFNNAGIVLYSNITDFNNSDVTSTTGIPVLDYRVRQKSKTSGEFLVKVLWPLLAPKHLSHVCETSSIGQLNVRLITRARKKNCEYLGQEFNEHHQLKSAGKSSNTTWCGTK